MWIEPVLGIEGDDRRHVQRLAITPKSSSDPLQVLLVVAFSYDFEWEAFQVGDNTGPRLCYVLAAGLAPLGLPPEPNPKKRVISGTASEI